MVFATVAVAAAPVRLAIIAEDQRIASAADFLTAELSKKESIQLLERREIEKVFREQGLSAQNKDYLKLGQILGAEGLLLLFPADDGFLGARLIAVRPGVVLGEVRSPWPVEDQSQWAKWMGSHFDPLLPKLGVLPKEAVPISVVTFRSALRSAESQEAERQLTLLTLERLTREPALFVLERRRLELLSAEKELRGMDAMSFWNGSYLLDAVIDKEGYAKETVTLSGQLVPPNGGQAITLEVSGSRTNLLQVVNQLAEEILAGLKVSPSGTPWSPAGEAERYFEEAKWAYHWRMLTEAAAAAEASWAMGKATKEVAELRLRAYSENGVDNVSGEFDLTRRLVGFVPRIVPAPGQFVMPEQPSYGSGIPPDAEKFAMIRQAMELYGQDFRRFIAPDPKPGWEWYDLGLSILDNASYWLRHYYYVTEARVGQEEAIASAQALAREMADLIGRHPGFTNCFARAEYVNAKANWPAWSGGAAQLRRKALPVLKAYWGAYWTTTPEQGLEFYRELNRSGMMAKARPAFLQQDFGERSGAMGANSFTTGGTLDDSIGALTYLIGWKWEDRKRALSVWHGFLDELCGATNDASKLEGLFMRCAQAPRMDQHEQYFGELLAFIEEHKKAFLTTAPGENIVEDIDALVKWRTGGVWPSPLAARDEHWKQFKAKMTEYQAVLAREAKLEEMKKYLAAGEYDYDKFSRLFSQSGYPFSADDAPALGPALWQYRSNLTAQAAALGGQAAEAQKVAPRSKQDLDTWARLSTAQTKLGWIIHELDRVEQLLKTPPVLSVPGTTPPAAAGTPTVAGQPRPTPGPAPGQARPNPFTGPNRNPGGPPGLSGLLGAGRESAGHLPGTASDPASLTASNVLEVRRFWRTPDRLPGSNDPVHLEIVNCCWRKDRLWVEARYDQLGIPGKETFFNRGAIYVVEPDILQGGTVVLDPQQFTLSKRDYTSRVERLFEVHDDWLYVSSLDVVRRWSLKTRTWEDVPAPVHGHARISFVDDRLLLSTEDSILEMAEGGKEARILASSRRRPAQTVLDSVEGYDRAPIIKGPQGSIITFVKGQFYELPSQAKDWQALGARLESTRIDSYVFDDGIILNIRSTDAERQMQALFSGARSPNLLFARGRSSSSDPKNQSWDLPAGVSVFDCPVCLEQRCIWVLAGGSMPRKPNGQPGAMENDGRDAVLFRWEPGQPRPLAIPVKLRLPAVRMSRGLGALKEQFVFVSTPKGLVVASSATPGFWLIPQDQLTERIKKWKDEMSTEKGARSAARTEAGSALAPAGKP